MKCIYFIEYKIYHKEYKNNATLPTALLVSLFHLTARISKLHKHVEALAAFGEGKKETQLNQLPKLLHYFTLMVLIREK